MASKLINAVFAIDQKIRYASILDRYGNLVDGGMRPGTVSINPEEENGRFFTQTIVSGGMADAWIKYFGQHNFSIIDHERLRVFQFPIRDGTLIVTGEPEISLDFANKIRNLIRSENM